jgi:hypothetical protein
LFVAIVVVCVAVACGVGRYTGAHKARFDADGKGRGLEGRVDHDKVGDLSEVRCSPGVLSTQVHTSPD